jgi:hypothetical protein
MKRAWGSKGIYAPSIQWALSLYNMIRFFGCKIATYQQCIRILNLDVQTNFWSVDDQQR